LAGRSTRVSDENAFMYLEELIEYNSTRRYLKILKKRLLSGMYPVNFVKTLG
jgi:ABC-type phosphate transport system ATPase subunit